MSNSPPTVDDELRQYIALLRRWLWLLLLTAIVAGSAAYVASSRMTPIYQASATVLVNEAGQEQTENYELSITADQLPRTYAEMMTDTPVEALGLPIMGLIARHDIDEEQPVAAAAPRSPVTEAFRALRTNIQYASVDRPVGSLVLTSAEQGIGKSTVLVNLALVLAQNDKRVVLVEGDLRRPTLHRLVDVDNTVGLADLFIRDEMAFDSAVQGTKYSNLSVITAGEMPPNPSELLGSARMTRILEHLQEQFDMSAMMTGQR